MTRGLFYLGKAIYFVFFATGFLVAVAFATGFFVATASFFCVVEVSAVSCAAVPSAALAAGFLIVGAAVAALAETEVVTNASATSDAVRIFFMLCPSLIPSNGIKQLWLEQVRIRVRVPEWKLRVFVSQSIVLSLNPA